MIKVARIGKKLMRFFEIDHPGLEKDCPLKTRQRMW